VTSQRVKCSIALMPELRSTTTFTHYWESEQRFEYFIIGISTALCAYVGQTLQPQRFGYNAYTLEVFSLVLVVTSVIFGFKRIEFGIWLTFLNHHWLHLGEIRGELASRPQGLFNKETGDMWTPADIDKKIKQINEELPETIKTIETAQAKIRYYKCRNVFLLLGFVGLFVSKILVPYAH
jgi:hypothetical protein